MTNPLGPRMTRYALRHVTSYRYARPVDLANHLLHLTPRVLPGQAVEAVALDVTDRKSVV